MKQLDLASRRLCRQSFELHSRVLELFKRESVCVKDDEVRAFFDQLVQEASGAADVHTKLKTLSICIQAGLSEASQRDAFVFDVIRMFSQQQRDYYLTVRPSRLQIGRLTDRQAAGLSAIYKGEGQEGGYLVFKRQLTAAQSLERARKEADQTMDCLHCRATELSVMVPRFIGSINAYKARLDVEKNLLARKHSALKSALQISRFSGSVDFRQRKRSPGAFAFNSLKLRHIELARKLEIDRADLLLIKKRLARYLKSCKAIREQKRFALGQLSQLRVDRNRLRAQISGVETKHSLRQNLDSYHVLASLEVRLLSVRVSIMSKRLKESLRHVMCQHSIILQNVQKQLLFRGRQSLIHARLQQLQLVPVLHAYETRLDCYYYILDSHRFAHVHVIYSRHKKYSNQVEKTAAALRKQKCLLYDLKTKTAHNALLLVRAALHRVLRLTLLHRQQFLAQEVQRIGVMRIKIAAIQQLQQTHASLRQRIFARLHARHARLFAPLERRISMLRINLNVYNPIQNNYITELVRAMNSKCVRRHFLRLAELKYYALLNNQCMYQQFQKVDLDVLQTRFMLRMRTQRYELTVRRKEQILALLRLSGVLQREETRCLLSGLHLQLTDAKRRARAQLLRIKCALMLRLSQRKLFAIRHQCQCAAGEPGRIEGRQASYCSTDSLSL